MARRRRDSLDLSGPGSSTSSSPAMSPSHRMNTGGGISGRSTLRKQNAAELLAKVMEQRDYDYDYDDEDGHEDLYQVHLPPPLTQSRRRDDKRIGKGPVNGRKTPAVNPVILPPPKFDDESDGDEIAVDVPRNRVEIPRKNARDRKEASTVKPVVLPPKFDDEVDDDKIRANVHRNPLENPGNNGRGSVSGKTAPAVRTFAPPPKFDDELDGDEIITDVNRNAVEIPQKNGRGTLKVRVPAYSRRNPIEDIEQNGDGKLNGSNVQFDVPAKQSDAQLKYKKR